MFTYLKNSVHSLTLLSTIMLAVSVLNHAYSNTTLPGDSCAPANLQQAVNLGLGYSQFGVTNNEPIGGNSFFVTCPVIFVDDDDTFDTMSVEVQYLSPVANNVLCAIISIETQVVPNAAFDAINLTIPVNPGNNAGQFSNTNTAALNIGNGTSKASVICAMQPQTRITHFVVDGS